MSINTVLRQIKPHELENLLQEVKNLPHEPLFSNFDYVNKPYTNLLDSLAIVLILWITSSILSRLLSIPFGSSTRSLATKAIYERFINLRITTLANINPRDYQTPPRRWFTNFWLRLFAIFFVALLLCMEVAIVFSQSTKPLIGSLSDLDIKTIALRPYKGPTRFNAHPDGCVSLISSPSGHYVHPLLLCNYKQVAIDRRTDVERKNSITFTTRNNQEWQTISKLGSTIWQMTNNVKLVPKGSDIEFSKEPILANLTRINFGMNQEGIDWFLEQAVELCNCELEISFSNDTSTKIDVKGLNGFNGRIPELQEKLFSLQMGMIQVTRRRWVSDDFLVKHEKASKVLENMLTTRRKYISGIILWVTLIAMIAVNILLIRFSPDLERPIDIAVERAMKLPEDKALPDLENVHCMIVDDELADSMDLEFRGRLNLRLRRKPNPYARNGIKGFESEEMDIVSIEESL